MIDLRTSTLAGLATVLLRRREIRFLLAGAYNTAFGYVAFLIVYWPLKATVSPEICLFLSYLPSLMSAYLIQKYFVFHPERWLTWLEPRRAPAKSDRPPSGRAGEFIRFSLVNTIALLSNLLFLPLATRYAGLQPPVAQALFLSIAVICSYVAHRTFSFRTQTRQ